MMDELKQYVNNRIALTKLEMVDRLVASFSGLVILLLIGAILFFFFLLLCIVLGIWFTDLFGNPLYGFLSAAGVFLFLFLLVLLFNKFLRRLFESFLIKKIFQEKKK